MNYNRYLQFLSYVPYNESNNDDLQDEINRQLRSNKNHFSLSPEIKNSKHIKVPSPENEIIASPMGLSIIANEISPSKSIDKKHFDFEFSVSPERKNRNIHETEIEKEKKNNLFYTIFVILIISWKCAYIIYYSIKEKDLMFILRNLCDCGIPFQYYVGKTYFSTEHFEDLVNKAKLLYRAEHNKYMNVYYIAFVIASVLYSIIDIIILIFVDQDNVSVYTTIYDEIDGWTKYLVIILFFTSSLYCVNIFFSNVYIFSIVFKIHSLDIVNFYTQIKGKYDNIPSELCNNMARLRTEYEESQEKLNMTLSAIAFFGGVPTYMMFLDVSDDVTNYSQYIYTLIFIGATTIYIKSIITITNAKGDLHKFSYSNELVENLLTRNQFNILNTPSRGLPTHRRNGSDIRSIVLSSENAESIDWFITYTLFGDEWDSFQLFGFAVNDLGLFKKGLVLIITFYATGKIANIFQLFT